MSAFELFKKCIESDNFFRSCSTAGDFLIVKVEQVSDEEFPSHFDSGEDNCASGSQSVNTSWENSTLTAETIFHPRITPGSVLKPLQEVWYSCNFCEKTLKTKPNMIRHMNLLHDPLARPFACRYCILRFNDERLKQAHEVVHEDEKASIFFCDICGASGSLEEGMKHHMVDDHRATGTEKRRGRKKAKCVEDDDSDEDFIATRKVKPSSETSFHPRVVPGSVLRPCQEVWYSCNFCNKSLKTRPNMIRHMSLLHDPITRPFYCRFCVLRFKDKRLKDSHESTEHEDEKVATILVCEICSASGCLEEGMKHHKEDDHKGDENERKKVGRKRTRRISSEIEDESDGDIKDEDFHGDSASVPLSNVDETKVLFHPRITLGSVRAPSKEVDNQVSKELSDELKKTSSTNLFHARPLPGSDSLELSDVIYSCNFCERKCKPRSAIRHHMKKVHDPRYRPFGCRFCVERFKTQKDLVEHEEASHDGGAPSTLFCDICGVSGSSKQGLDYHMMDDHLGFAVPDNGYKHACQKCRSRFKIKKALQNHLENHHEGTVKCRTCSESFCSKPKLQQHILMVHEKAYRELNPDEVKQETKCCACNEEFKSEADLLSHCQIHLNTFTKLVCDHRAMPPKTFEIFLAHCKYSVKPRTHECLRCKRIFAFDSKFMIHVNGHKRDGNERKVKCDKCGSKFRTLTELDVHEKVKHQLETLFICPICAKSMGSKTSLDNHIKYIHNRDKMNKFGCKICSMKFPNRKRLANHEATHSTERPHGKLAKFRIYRREHFNICF